MTDTEKVVRALREAGKIIAAHVEPGHHRKAELALRDLIDALDTRELLKACERLEKRSSLRVGSRLPQTLRDCQDFCV